MIDKMIELRKEFGIHGIAIMSAFGMFVVGWYVKELLIYLQKIMQQVLTNVDTYGILLV